MEYYPLETRRVTQSLNGSDQEAQLQSGITLVDRYTIQRVIGVGGMGSVYCARDLHFPNVTKLVAVKEMICQTADPAVRQTMIQNFEREANILASLSHPAIPRIYDYFTQGERSYLVLEFIHGKDLEVIINEADEIIPEDQAIQWAIELCDVLDFLHNHKPEPIIFRDMKPSNVMINQHNHVTLVDFGIAKVFRSGQKGTMIGTEGYSPPEQYRGEAGPQADIYALGATLHHLLTRTDPRLEPPFTFGDRQIRRINPSISLELEAVINKALKYNPEERFKSAVEMKDALTLTARKTGALSRISPRTARPSQEEIIKPLWSFACEDEIRGSPTVENGVLYIGSYDNNLYALKADNGEFIWKYATDGGIVGKPALAEENVFIGSEDHRLHVVSARSGKVVWTYYTDAPIRCSPRIAEGHVFIGSDDNGLHAVNIISSRRAWRFETSDPVRSTPFVANEVIYFGSESGDVFCIDFRSDVKWRIKAKRAVTSSPILVDGVLYFTSLDGNLYAVEAKTGWVIWRFNMGKGSICSPCAIENKIFVGSADAFIYCVDAQSSKEVWRFQTEHQVSGSPIIYQDAVYCGSADGNLYCLDYRSGRLRWKYKTGGAITGTPVVYNDIIYIGSLDHCVYALLP